MRIVRFHLEPWQKGGSVESTPSPSLSGTILVLSPKVLRRQRPPDVEECVNLGQCSKPNTLERKRRLSDRIRCRYPKTVKRLASICGDIIAKYVCVL